MGCHTWFSNKTSCIPNKDIRKLRWALIECKKSHCSYETLDEWREHDEDALDYFKVHLKDAIRYNNVSGIKLWTKMIRQIITNNPDKSEWKKFQWVRHRILNSRKTKLHKRELISLAIKEMTGFRKDNYDLTFMGWSNNFRIYDYDADPWYSVEDFLTYLEKNPDVCVWHYEQRGDQWEKVDSREYAIEVVKQFFKEYPNGNIHLG